MKRVGIGVAAVLLGAVLSAPPGCRSLQVAHEIGNPRYELRGRHTALLCQSCHPEIGGGCLGSGKPKPHPTNCSACHSDDIPGPNHYTGRECSACHTEQGWADIIGSTTDTGTPPIEDTGTVPIEDTGFDHDALPADTPCAQACHERDRPADPPHWVDLPRMGDWWDCGPCHTTNDWAEQTAWVDPNHPIHTPHGTLDSFTPTSPALWIFSCTPCHTTDPPYSGFQCTEPCHESIRFVPPEEDHNSFDGGDEHECIDCHTWGDFQ